MGKPRWKALVAIAAVGAVCVFAIALLTSQKPAPSPVDKLLDPSWPQDAASLVFVGTSLTASNDWVERLAECLPPRTKVGVVARNGETSIWGLAQVEAILAHKPDIVFIEFSINDADVRHRISLSESKENHRALVDRIVASRPGTQFVFMTMSPAHGIRKYVLRPRLPAYYALYRELADELDTGLLDLYPRWKQLRQGDREQSDGLHPSSDAAARVIVPALSGFLGLECSG